jgi:hypothetical protein
MGIRRERPSAEVLGNSVQFRFSDGTTKNVPVNDLRGPVTADVCCFCGQGVEHSDEQRLRLSVRWVEEGRERTQSWAAHHACLAERMHDRVSGTGPFFDD